MQAIENPTLINPCITRRINYAYSTYCFESLPDTSNRPDTRGLLTGIYPSDPLLLVYLVQPRRWPTWRPSNYFKHKAHYGHHVTSYIIIIRQAGVGLYLTMRGRTWVNPCLSAVRYYQRAHLLPLNLPGVLDPGIAVGAPRQQGTRSCFGYWDCTSKFGGARRWIRLTNARCQRSEGSSTGGRLFSPASRSSRNHSSPAANGYRPAPQHRAITGSATC